MKFNRTKVYNFENALYGMRNPKNSWDRIDSEFGYVPAEGVKYNADHDYTIYNDGNEYIYIGPNDMKLATTLIHAGNEHRKFLRQIMVSVDITAPLYFWKEADTYKVATVANSTSTMHKLTSKPITIDCFEIDDYQPETEGRTIMTGTTPNFRTVGSEISNIMIPFLEDLRQRYLETKDVKYWKELVRWLPESWLQTRTWTCNYETLRSIYHQRKTHKLMEWHSFCTWIETLPYAKELIID